MLENYLFLFSLGINVFGVPDNNVCEQFSQYYLRKEGCYYNPDQNLEVSEIAKRHGYPFQNYTVVTEDGYELSVFRLKNSTGNPVFLQHGISLSAMCFVDIGNSSLAFMLFDAGFDVWLGNFRGNRYSNKHKYLSTDQPKYWNFSFHEMGIYDLKSQLALVAEETAGQEKIIYLGYSMGTTTSYIYSSLYPLLAQNQLRLIASLAPIAYMQRIRSIVAPFAPFYDILKLITSGVILQRSQRSTDLIKKLCLSSSFQMQLCQTLTQTIFGFDREQMNPETIPITLVQNNDAISTKTLMHYAQYINNGKFRYFDYRHDNFKHYGSLNIPSYNVTNIRVPIYMVYADNDYLASPENVKKLYNELPEEIRFGLTRINYEDFNHADFILAKDVRTLCYNDLIKVFLSLKPSAV